ncbi:MAG: hypothetical protein JJU34_19150 [Lunatimonas sp.]|uniref:hypothetical protein n=1 Tax=Lunatimonas sp. TaxID=2060141 RepID=UPI00263B46DE|nr:hypothetical protein [Lunatimonas sp.]MCC5939404.1 hypothetical protein [Lunatimonas sp.]
MSKFKILAFRFLTDVLNLFVLAAAMVEVATDAGFNLIAECNFDWIPGQLLKREH